MANYFSDLGGLPDQGQTQGTDAIFTEAYAFLPREVMRDIVTSYFPHWRAARFWILARPLSGFAETFSYYVGEVAAGGGSGMPEPDPTAEAVLFVVSGHAVLTLNGQENPLSPGSYAYISPGEEWSFSAETETVFHWIRKAYEPADGVATPTSFVTHENSHEDIGMPGTEGRWATKRFVDPSDLRHDMHVNIVSFEPGAVIPFMETHVMEHGLYVLEGEATYRLNRDDFDVKPGDFMWLRAFCPQACQAKGTGRFRYLLYKDVNRHPGL